MIADKQLEISGEISRILFQNHENGFCVAKIIPDDKANDIFGNPEPQTISGTMPGLTVGAHISIIGEHTSHPKFGNQIKVIRCQSSAPTTESGIEKYLSSGIILGIGKVYAEKIVKHFGIRTIDILNENPMAMMQVPGIGEVRAKRIAESWTENKAINEIMIKLQSFEISTAYAMKIYKYYGEKACRVISENPYQLAMDIHGIGFKKADMIARKNGYDMTSRERAEAGILYVLDEAAGSGNTYLPEPELIETAKELLSEENFTFDELKIKESLSALEKSEKTHNLSGKIFLKKLFSAEESIANKITDICDHPCIAGEVPATAIEEFQAKNHLRLSEEQERAILSITKNGGVSVLTGGPGTGKTTIIKAILSLLEGKHITLAAPTGRAAKRITETTGRSAKTIHRLLKFNPANRAFEHNEENPIDTQMIIIDESSMLDVQLACSLLKAVHPKTSVLFVGDIDQLPSVGAGNFLSDLIGSGKVRVCRLSKIFRQAQQSMIISNAHKINQGMKPEFEPDPDQHRDFFFFNAEEPVVAQEQILRLAAEWINAKFGIAQNNIQVISPMHKGELGVSALNQKLQERLNPKGKEFLRGFLKIREGDRVIQTKNNYDKDVFNGDVGIIDKIDEENGLIRICYDDRLVDYIPSDLDEISLAYAVSIHKSQGSEYPAVIIPIHTQHFIMLQRNLIYTGITRGKRLVCLVGTKKALAMAIRNNQSKSRYSELKNLLQYRITDDLPF